MGRSIQPHNGLKLLWDLGIKEIEKYPTTITAMHALLAESQLRYGDVVWGGLSKAKLAALQRFHTRALDIINNAKTKDTWSCPRMSVGNIICPDRNVMIYKIIQTLPIKLPREG